MQLPHPRLLCLPIGKEDKRAWRPKTAKPRDQDPSHLDPGGVVSVDQMRSSTPGLITQLTGKLTTKRYEYATVYADQASSLGFIYLQKTSTAKETHEGKVLFEKYAQDRGITIRKYHTDNGIFRANKWVQSCIKGGQTLSFTGVNAHHQNGVAEKRIRDLQEMARISLKFAKRRWPDAITASFWPYAIRQANRVLNETPSPKDTAH